MSVQMLPPPSGRGGPRPRGCLLLSIPPLPGRVRPDLFWSPCCLLSSVSCTWQAPSQLFWTDWLKLFSTHIRLWKRGRKRFFCYASLVEHEVCQRGYFLPSTWDHKHLEQESTNRFESQIWSTTCYLALRPWLKNTSKIIVWYEKIIWNWTIYMKLK